MRLVSRKFNLAMQAEAVELICDDAEDTWHLYNLISPGDLVAGKTTRKVAKKDRSKHGIDEGESSRAQERVVVDVVLDVKSTSYDPQNGALRVSGRNVRANEFVPLGAHQSMDVHLHTAYRIAKDDGWDSVAEATLRDSLSQDRDGAIAAVVMHDSAAHVCLVTPHRTVVRATVNSAVPKKQEAATAIDRAIRTFFATTLATLTRSLDFSTPRPLILASPGFTASNFRDFIRDRSHDGRDANLKALATAARVVHTHSGHVHGLNEVLRSAEMQSLMSGMRYTHETRHLDRFMEALRRDNGCAWYGPRAVESAVAEGAVGSGPGLLLIGNELFRSKDLAVRKRFVALVDAVKAAGGETRILSSDHDSGKRLAMLGNVAAILTFPLFDLDDEGEEENDGAEGEADRHISQEEQEQQETLRRQQERARREDELDSDVVATFGGGKEPVI